MSLRFAGSFHHAIGVAALAVAFLYFPAPSGAQRGPFAGLAGNWSGSGFIMVANGGRERLRCRATYAVGGDGTRLQQNLRCASDSYRFDVNGDVVSEGGVLTGTWSEANRNVSGNVSGRVSGGQIQARIEGPGFSAGMTINTRGSRQSVTISSPGHEITQVSIDLTKSRL
jgi:hypothetical protein